MWDRLLFTHVALAAAYIKFFSTQFTAQSLKSNMVALSLEHIMEASVAARPGLVLNSVVIAGTLG